MKLQSSKKKIEQKKITIDRLFEYVDAGILSNSVIKPWAYIMAQAFFGELIQGGDYITGGLYTEGNLR